MGLSEELDGTPALLSATGLGLEDFGFGFGIRS